MTNVVRSKNGIPIRLTDERWSHIVEEHNELSGLRLEVLETVFLPERVYEGGEGALLAIRELEGDKWMVAAYREFQDDGSIITAFLTRRTRYFEKRIRIWP